MSAKEYVAADWERLFAFNGLRTFDDFWKLEAKWFEEPNQRRGGWSGVARCELQRPEGGTVAIFLKRQEDHVTRTLAHPIRGLSTFVREFESIMRYRERNIPSLTPLYFACRRVDGHLRAILLTEELTGFRSLEEIGRGWTAVPRSTRMAIIKATAGLLKLIHSHQLSHNCFYPKHVFLRVNGLDQVEARVIDLEKTKWRPFGLDRNFRDMRRLNSPGLPWSRSDRVRFFREYLGVERLTPEAKRKWRRIEQRHFDKHPGAVVSPARAVSA